MYVNELLYSRRLVGLPLDEKATGMLLPRPSGMAAPSTLLGSGMISGGPRKDEGSLLEELASLLLPARMSATRWPRRKNEATVPVSYGIALT